jgi:hypothetical protein
VDGLKPEERPEEDHPSIVNPGGRCRVPGLLEQ